MRGPYLWLPNEFYIYEGILQFFTKFVKVPKNERTWQLFAAKFDTSLLQVWLEERQPFQVADKACKDDGIPVVKSPHCRVLQLVQFTQQLGHCMVATSVDSSSACNAVQSTGLATMPINGKVDILTMDRAVKNTHCIPAFCCGVCVCSRLFAVQSAGFLFP